MGPNWREKIAPLAAIVVFAVAACVAANAQQDPQQLVKETIYNELHAQKHPRYWMFRDSNQQSGVTKVSRVVETPQCWFRWPLSVNGHPPTAQQEQQDRDKLNQLVSDQSARQKNRQELNHDAKQAQNLMEMLPDAFLYTNDGEQDGNIRLKFRPNPHYNPPTRPAKVFHNMEGTLLINPREKRLAGISGTLMHDVTFGWGVLGRLYQGGTFNVKQTEIAPNDWEVTYLDVHIRGKALFFHTISEQQHEVESDFEPVPANLALAKAAELAEHGNQDASAAAK